MLKSTHAIFDIKIKIHVRLNIEEVKEIIK